MADGAKTPKAAEIKIESSRSVSLETYNGMESGMEDHDNRANTRPKEQEEGA